MNVNWSEENESLRQELLEIVRIFNDRGWSWATSTNYSFRNPKPMDNTFTISSSGIDKSFFKARDLMVVDEAGQPIEGYQDMKPSAETLLHTMIYQVFPAGAVLHTHSPMVRYCRSIIALSGKFAWPDLKCSKAYPASLATNRRWWYLSSPTHRI